MTLLSKQIVYELLTNNGIYEEDPQVDSVWRYRNVLGRTTYAFFYDNKELHETIYVHDPVLLWDKENRLTEAGKNWIESYGFQD